MSVLMKVKGISIEMFEDRVSVHFDCATEIDADQLCDIIADALAAGEVKFGSLSLSSSPITSDSAFDRHPDSREGGA